MSDDKYSKRPRNKLYKCPKKGKICGVCAGIAEYFDIETWVVRVIAISLLIFGNGGMVIVYFVACWLLDSKPKNIDGPVVASDQRHSDNSTADERYHRPHVQDVWRKGSFTEQSLRRVRSKFERIEARMRNLESYVTSDKFSLHRAFKDIQD